MLYNLPNGKTIYLTIEQYLNLTDDDIQYLMSINAGCNPSIFSESSFKTKRSDKTDFDAEYFPDDIKEEENLSNNYFLDDDSEEDYYDDINFSDTTTDI